MWKFITDRDKSNVDRRDELARKGWQGMTAEEQSEWLGDPLLTEGANLLPYGPNYSGSVDVRYDGEGIIATATTGGIYLYAISIIGEAYKYEGKTFTLSVDSINIVGGATPQLALYWHDNNGFEYAGASITSEGSVTFTASPNTAGRASLAMYIYVTTDGAVEAGERVRFNGVMFESGSVRHPYVPFVEVLETPATKGAYNYSDLNRVERAVKGISDEYGLGLITKTDWAMWEIPTEADMARYLSNLNVMWNIFNLGDLPSLPESMNSLTYSTANDIEKILSRGYEIVASWYRTNEVFCGEV